MKQLKESLWSFVLQPDEVENIDDHFHMGKCSDYEKRLQNANISEFLLLFSFKLSFYTTTSLFLQGGTKQYSSVKLLKHIKLCASFSPFCI